MIPSLYTHIAVATAAGVLAWTAQGWKLGEEMADMRATTANEVTESLRRTNARVEAINTQYRGALNAARTREATARRNAELADAQSDGLRAQLTEAARRIASAPPASVAEYAVTVSGLFDNCQRDYRGVAAKATGHANDVRAYRDAWPMNK